MSGRAQKLLGEALDLTDAERADVALELVASLDAGRLDTARLEIHCSAKSAPRPHGSG